MYGRPEQALLQEGGVVVTTSRLVVGQQTFSIASLSSVSPITNPAPSTGYFIGAVVFAMLVLLVFFIAHVVAEINVVAIGFAAPFAMLSFILAVVGMRVKPTYGVMITSGGATRQIITSRDRGFTIRIVAALNHSLSVR